MNRQQKLSILQQAILGNTDPLRELKDNHPPRYTPERAQERRDYLSELLQHPCSEEEFRNMFGQYDIERWEKPDRQIICVILPNSMRHYPAYCHGI